ncbi:hypothetical protein M9H77_14444 [Catharanthus roseus]|uniref:Uncharacterized protein n=1 Tax=Catharanthus roseus TaxID=4058 RepID=A0ACC0BN52_CATRO|nr:hypothetical protein M9H77_14444 [Catharanthus roseus]
MGSLCHLPDGRRKWIQFKFEKLSDLCYGWGELDHVEADCEEKKVDTVARTHICSRSVDESGEWKLWFQPRCRKSPSRRVKLINLEDQTCDAGIKSTGNGIGGVVGNTGSGVACSQVSTCPPGVTWLPSIPNIVMRANIEEAQAIKDCLDTFCKISGQTVNYEKFVIHFSANVSHDLKQQIVNKRQVLECDHKGKYLGLPFYKGKSQVQAFVGVVEKMQAKLSGCRGRILSQAGRIVLIKSVTQPQPSYATQTYFLPASICDKLDQLIRNLWWGNMEEGKRKIHLRALDTICKPEKAGDMGFRKTKDNNIAFITKLS